MKKPSDTTTIISNSPPNNNFRLVEAVKRDIRKSIASLFEEDTEESMDRFERLTGYNWEELSSELEKYKEIDEKLLRHLENEVFLEQQKERTHPLLLLFGAVYGLEKTKAKYGENVAFWLLQNYKDNNIIKQKMLSDCGKAGIDRDIFNMAQSTLGQENRYGRSDRVHAMYKAILQLLEDASIEKMQSEIIIKNIIGGRTQIDNYSIECRSRLKREKGKLVDIGERAYLDTPIGFLLKYKGKPCAIVGFESYGDNGIIIRQIQGIRQEDGKSHGLSSIAWVDVCVDSVKCFCKEYGYSEIWIQSGRNNKWCKPLGVRQKIALNAERAKSRYDEEAERMGFKKQSEEGNWFKKAA